MSGRSLARAHPGEQFRQFKPLFVVRRPDSSAAHSCCGRAFFSRPSAGARLVEPAGFAGDQTLLPAILLLTGVGLILMISLRDPVRDNLLFVDFAQGAAGGCVLLAAASRARLRAPVRQA